jgi:superfamily II DNA or RNA helicase
LRFREFRLIVLGFDRGSIVASGGPIPHGKYESRTDSYVAPAFRYGDIIEHLEENEIEYRDEVFEGLSCPRLGSSIKLRDYQEKALGAWRKANHRGLIVLPTGAGKTVIAMKAIENLCEATLIVVPTLVLADQWRQQLEEEFGTKIGAVGGGSRQVRAVTVATYDSASLRADRMGNLFRLLIFDEVHHLPAESYRRIGLWYMAPHRMGLTATLSRDDGSRFSLLELVGEVVYEMAVDELAGIHLADYTVETVQVPLSPEEQMEYDRGFAVYRGFIRSRGIRIRSARDYQRLVLRTGRDPEARRAILARNRAMDVALNSSAKVDHLKRLLQSNPDDKALIFTRHNKLVYRISREMLMPAITHQTPKEERQEILQRFKAGKYRRIVTSQVLDEGVDVPDASLAVVLSGTGSSRQFIQRLGRVLRKGEGKRARMVELVSQGTAETRISRRRRRG